MLHVKSTKMYVIYPEHWLNVYWCGGTTQISKYRVYFYLFIIRKERNLGKKKSNLTYECIHYSFEGIYQLKYNYSSSSGVHKTNEFLETFKFIYFLYSLLYTSHCVYNANKTRVRIVLETFFFFNKKNINSCMP